MNAKNSLLFLEGVPAGRAAAENKWMMAAHNRKTT